VGTAISCAFGTRSYTGRAHYDPAGPRPWLANLWTTALSCWESAGACTAICLVVCHLPRNSQIGLNQCPRRLKRFCCSHWKHVKGETRCRTEGSDLGPFLQVGHFPCWVQRASERDADSLQRERDTEYYRPPRASRSLIAARTDLAFAYCRRYFSPPPPLSLSNARARYFCSSAAPAHSR
jgi:hypothetical protein